MSGKSAMKARYSSEREALEDIAQVCKKWVGAHWGFDEYVTITSILRKAGVDAPMDVSAFHGRIIKQQGRTVEMKTVEVKHERIKDGKE